ncbi:hypothetical protein Tco_1300847 [Tanacetum coccineum]
MVPLNNLGHDLNGKSVNETQYKGFDLKGYPDSDYAGCNMDMKSTSGACQLLGGKLVCWSAKKQQSVAMSSAKAEYVAAARCCANILWMKRSGYQQKDRKPSQNDKTEHGMEKISLDLLELCKLSQNPPCVSLMDLIEHMWFCRLF